MERWRPVLGYEGRYRVSDKGRVRSLKRHRILSPVLSRRGYLHVNLYLDGRAKNKLVHRLVVEAFRGRIPHRHQVNHIDGSKQDNCLTNLEVVTGEENRKHALARGLTKHRYGEDNKSSKLTEQDVRSIRRLRLEEVPVPEIAHRFRVSQRTIYSILSGQSWRHVN